MESSPKRQKTCAEATVIDLLDSPLPSARPINPHINTAPSSLPASDTPSSTEKENHAANPLLSKKEESIFPTRWQPSTSNILPPAHHLPPSTTPPEVLILDSPPPSKPPPLTSGSGNAPPPPLTHNPSFTARTLPSNPSMPTAPLSQRPKPTCSQPYSSAAMVDAGPQAHMGNALSLPAVPLPPQPDTHTSTPNCNKSSHPSAASGEPASLMPASRGLLRAAGVKVVPQSLPVKPDWDMERGTGIRLTRQHSISGEEPTALAGSKDAGLQEETKLSDEAGKVLNKKEAAALLKMQKAAAREEEKKRKAAEKEQERRERDLQKQRLKEAREQKALQQQQEKASKKAAQDLERQLRGKNCMQEIVVLIDRESAKVPLFWQCMGKLKEERSVTQPPFKFEIEDLPMAPYNCIAFKRVLPMALTQVEALPNSQGGSLPFPSLSQCSQGVSSQEDSLEVPVPFVLIVFDDANQFIDEVVKDRLQGLIKAAVRHHPEATLGILTVDLDKTLVERERKHAQPLPNGMLFNRQVVEDACVQLALTCPAVRFKHAPNEIEASEYVRDLTRALAEQPYKVRASLLESYHNTNNNQTRDMQLRVERLPPNSAHLAKALHGAKGLNLGPSACAVVGEQYGSLSKVMRMFLFPGERSLEDIMDEMAKKKLSETGRKLGEAAVKKLFKFLTADDPETLIENAA